MTKTALVVVDLQEDFLPPGGSLAVAHGRDIVPKICDLLKYPWTTVIATQDWHPSNHISFASQHKVEPYTERWFAHPLNEKDETGTVRTMKQTVWPDHCVQNTKGSELEAGFLNLFNKLSEQMPKSVVKKGYLQDREYYSCFRDTWKLHSTEMEKTLTSLGIEDVIFVGLAYDFCVMNSAIDCLKLKFNTFVLREYSKSVFPDNDENTDKMYKDNGVTILQHISEYEF